MNELKTCRHWLKKYPATLEYDVYFGTHETLNPCRTSYYVMCRKCGKRTDEFRTKEQAILAWNHQQNEGVIMSGAGRAAIIAGVRAVLLSGGVALYMHGFSLYGATLLGVFCATLRLD